MNIMKKSAIILILILLTANISLAQINKALGDFSAVKVFDRINVELVKSSENKIEISGKRSDEVEIVNKSGLLKIRMKFGKLLEGDDITAKLYFKDIQSVDGSEGAYIISDEIFKQTSFEITAKEGAEIRLALEVSKAKIKSVTGGIIRIHGKAQNQEASLGTGGILEAAELQTTQTTVSITTGGEADVRASELVDAQVRAGGTITIYGSPKQINKKTILGGDIIESKQ
jgi:putative autotransporter adhesin-like protein